VGVMTVSILPTNRRTVFWMSCGLFGMIVLGASGCGGRADSSPAQTSSSDQSAETRSEDPDHQRPQQLASPAERQSIRQVAAVASDLEPADDEFPLATPEKGTPEWILREIARIRTQLPAIEDGAALSAAARSQHETIIGLARQVVAATHQDPTREQLFNNAVHYLSDSRLALALDGDTEQA